MKSIFNILFLFFAITASGQTYSSMISDSTILDFMKWEIKNGEKYEFSKFKIKKKTSQDILKYDTLNFVFPDSLSKDDFNFNLYFFNTENNIDTIFNEDERTYLFNQFTSMIDVNWSHKIKNSKIRKWKNPKNTYKYSIPIFSKDERYVLIKKSFYCGSLCGYGGTYLYMKIGDKKWKLIKILTGWIS